MQTSEPQCVVQGDCPLTRYLLFIASGREMRISQCLADLLLCVMKVPRFQSHWMFMETGPVSLGPLRLLIGGATLEAQGCWDISSRVACHPASTITFWLLISYHLRAFRFSRGSCCKSLNNSPWSCGESLSVFKAQLCHLPAV